MLHAAQHTHQGSMPFQTIWMMMSTFWYFPCSCSTLIHFGSICWGLRSGDNCCVTFLGIRKRNACVSTDTSKFRQHQGEGGSKQDLQWNYAFRCSLAFSLLKMLKVSGNAQTVGGRDWLHCSLACSFRMQNNAPVVCWKNGLLCLKFRRLFSLHHL